MKIASIDYGLNIGFAIADFNNESLSRLHLGTHRDADLEVAQRVIAENCRCVIMEEPPYSYLGGSGRSFYNILGHLSAAGYGSGSNFSSQVFQDILENRMEYHWILRCPPGHWKPVFQALDPDLSAWSPKTKHEKDAMGLLWHTFRSMLGKEIPYV